MGEAVVLIAGGAVAVAGVGLLAFVVVMEFVTAYRAQLYKSRGYKVTFPSGWEALWARPLVEAPDDFVMERKWLDSGLKFKTPGGSETKRS